MVARSCQLGMTRPLLIILCCVAFFLGSCKQYAYYQSPFQANTSSYKAMPVGGVEPVALTFASGALMTAGTGDKLRDGLWGFNGNIYRSHSHGIFRGFYGLTGMAGSYRVRNLANTTPYLSDKYPSDSIIGARSGAKFFGGLGATAGLYVSTPIGRRSEWRVIGLELNYLHEFGHYASFREKLPDTAANLISKSRNFVTFGFHSDLEFQTRRGYSGFKMGAVFSARNETRYSNSGAATRMLPGYFSVTYHYTRERITTFYQANLGTYAAGLMIGINYRL